MRTFLIVLIMLFSNVVLADVPSPTGKFNVVGIPRYIDTSEVVQSCGTQARKFLKETFSNAKTVRYNTNNKEFQINDGKVFEVTKSKVDMVETSTSYQDKVDGKDRYVSWTFSVMETTSKDLIMASSRFVGMDGFACADTYVQSLDIAED